MEVKEGDSVSSKLFENVKHLKLTAMQITIDLKDCDNREDLTDVSADPCHAAVLARLI
jgi:hypothetical protein